MQNAYVAHHNRIVWRGWRDRQGTKTIDEAQDFAVNWLWTYNGGRLNISIDGITSAQTLNMTE